MTDTAKPTHVRLVEVDPEYAGQRIDNFLLTLLKGVPPSLLHRILRRGGVRVGGIEPAVTIGESPHGGFGEDVPLISGVGSSFPSAIFVKAGDHGNGVRRNRAVDGRRGCEMEGDELLI